MTDKATAVLVNWRRPENIPQIIERLAEQPFVGEIRIWDNADEDYKSLVGEWMSLGMGKRVFVSRLSDRRNILLLGRFRAIAAAEHEWIVTQDDDVLVNNWPELWAERRDDRIVGNMFRDEDDSFNGLIRVPKCPAASDIWLGYGSVFRRALIGDTFDRYKARWGEDDVLHRDADRIFAVSLGVHHHAIQADVTKLPGIDGPMAIHKDGREKLTRLARKRAAEMIRT